MLAVTVAVADGVAVAGCSVGEGDGEGVGVVATGCAVGATVTGDTSTVGEPIAGAGDACELPSSTSDANPLNRQTAEATKTSVSEIRNNCQPVRLAARRSRQYRSRFPRRKYTSATRNRTRARSSIPPTIYGTSLCRISGIPQPPHAVRNGSIIRHHACKLAGSTTHPLSASSIDASTPLTLLRKRRLLASEVTRSPGLLVSALTCHYPGPHYPVMNLSGAVFS